MGGTGMEKLKELIDLCKQRQQLFTPNVFGNGELFNNYNMDENYLKLTRQINRLSKGLDIYNISFYDRDLTVAFGSLAALQKIVGEEPLSKRYSEDIDKYKYSVTLYDGALTLMTYEKDADKEEHKKAQAI